MKRILLTALAMMLCLTIFSGCNKECDHNWERIENYNESTAQDKCTKCGETRLYTDPDNNSNPASELDNRKIVVEQTSWEKFSNALGEHAVDSDRIQALTKAIKISGFKTTSLNYIEYLPANESALSDWEFNVYWEETDATDAESNEIRYHLFYVSNGVDVLAATNGYTQYHCTDDIYTKRINNGKTAYVCLLGNNMFMRIVISNNCPDFESVSQELINYAFEFEQMIDK